MNALILLNKKGVQDKLMIPKQQITQPEIIKMSFNNPINLKGSDLLNIKGFIVNKNNIDNLKNTYIEFTDDFNKLFRIPFSFLIYSNATNVSDFNRNNEIYSFIDFQHDYFFNHKLLIVKMVYNTLNVCLISNDIDDIDDNNDNNDDNNDNNDIKDFNIEIVIEKTYLEITERNEYLLYSDPTIPGPINLEKDSYNIRNIQHFNIPLRGLSEKNVHIYKTNIDTTLLNQGLFIIKNNNHQIINIKMSLDDTCNVLDYDDNLLNIYNETVGNLIYYGFNVSEKYNSNNLIGCINMSLYNKITVIIKLKSIKEIPDTYLDIYIPQWNTLVYNKGLFKLRYVK